MADNKIYNYTLIEWLHFSYLLRDSLEYAYEPLVISADNFEKRKNLYKAMLNGKNFISKWISENPSEDIKKTYPEILNYFKRVYDEEYYLSFENRKVIEDKEMEFLEDTVKIYQLAEDILTVFYKEYKKQENAVDESLIHCIDASLDYYRTIITNLIFVKVIKYDNKYKEVLSKHNNELTYESNLCLNYLKKLIMMFNFAKQKYNESKFDIVESMNCAFKAFKALDGTLIMEEENNLERELTQEEKIELAKKTIEEASNKINHNIRVYEPIWKQTYMEVVKYMNANPLVAPGN